MILEIEKKIPDELRSRLKDANHWLKESFDKVKAPVQNVEEFVILMDHCKEINEKFQSVRDTITLVDDMLNVLIEKSE